jgi:hypothetical protein
VPLAEIKNSKQLEAWLLKQPREVSVAFAARAALRVLPVIWTAHGEDFKGGFFADMVLPVFRATGVAWAAAKYPAQAMQLAAHAYAAAYAAAAYAYAAATDAATDAATVLGFPDSAYAAARSAFWSAVSYDAARVEEGATASGIAGSLLWPQGQPDKLHSLWQELKNGAPRGEAGLGGVDELVRRPSRKPRQGRGTRTCLCAHRE